MDSLDLTATLLSLARTAWLCHEDLDTDDSKVHKENEAAVQHQARSVAGCCMAGCACRTLARAPDTHLRPQGPKAQLKAHSWSSSGRLQYA